VGGGGEGRDEVGGERAGRGKEGRRVLRIVSEIPPRGWGGGQTSGSPTFGGMKLKKNGRRRGLTTFDQNLTDNM
jgi:hypothetical protein